MELLGDLGFVCVVIGMTLLVLWLKFRYWWGGELEPAVTVDPTKVYGLTGTRKVMRILAGIGLVIAAIICFLTGNLLPGGASLLLGLFCFITPLFTLSSGDE